MISTILHKGYYSSLTEITELDKGTDSDSWFERGHKIEHLLVSHSRMRASTQHTIRAESHMPTVR